MPRVGRASYPCSVTPGRLTSFPTLEIQGANLILECVLNAVHRAMEQRRITKLRNLYIQLDNANKNKNWTLYAGLASLVLLGK